MAFKIVFTPHPVLAYEKRRKERFVGSSYERHKDAVKTLSYLQESVRTDGFYKIVPADYQLRDV